MRCWMASAMQRCRWRRLRPRRAPTPSSQPSARCGEWSSADFLRDQADSLGQLDCASMPLKHLSMLPEAAHSLHDARGLLC